MIILTDVVGETSNLIGLPCCGKRVGRNKSLTICFGKNIAGSSARGEKRAEWEIGTYTAAWRIIKNDKILCASLDVVDSLEELNSSLQLITLGNFLSIDMMSKFDVRLNLDSGNSIEFIGVSSDDDEMFHIFGPEYLYIEYVWLYGWKIGKSNEPWKR